MTNDRSDAQATADLPKGPSGSKSSAEVDLEVGFGVSHVPDLGQIPGEFQAHTNSELSNEQVRAHEEDTED